MSTNGNPVSDSELQKALEEQQAKLEKEQLKGKGRATINGKSKNANIVIEAIDLVEFYNTHITPLAHIFKPMSSKAGICPFHNDTDPSLHANLKSDKKYYHCFGCGYGGDIIKTYRQIQNNYFKRTISQKEAIKELAVLYNLELVPDEEDNDSADKFKIAKFMLTGDRYLEEHTGQVTLSKYENNNREILHSGLSFEQIKNQLGELDMLLTAYLEE